MSGSDGRPNTSPVASQEAGKQDLPERPGTVPALPAVNLAATLAAESTQQVQQVRPVAANRGTIWDPRGKAKTQEEPSGNETIHLGGAINMPDKLIWKRLDSQKTAFMANTFAEYVKDYDIETGAKKIRINGRRLKDDEALYVKRMNMLVGGPAIRLNPFERTRFSREGASSLPA
eukprot:gnl/TRDRNA2_/TRDRNA2_143906_c2_seq1.p1 gnl/TRDRNA2_/TRDRNA2_143906_c2~~gnl/TRDRNA2_/TRDRNA2_143906_c2_seq1.p1  ORF type:complete len:193 (-),score=36.98 gnl/TRDRNA2_/TRDRNA2_143906_c2_seq1:130-654(-)